MSLVGNLIDTIPNNHRDTGNYFLYLLKLKQIWLTCVDVIVNDVMLSLSISVS